MLICDTKWRSSVLYYAAYTEPPTRLYTSPLDWVCRVKRSSEKRTQIQKNGSVLRTAPSDACHKQLLFHALQCGRPDGRPAPLGDSA